MLIGQNPFLQKFIVSHICFKLSIEYDNLKHIHCMGWQHCVELVDLWVLQIIATPYPHDHIVD